MAAGRLSAEAAVAVHARCRGGGRHRRVDAAVKGVAVGDRMIVKMRHGAYSDEAVVTAAQLTPMPSTFD